MSIGTGAPPLEPPAPGALPRGWPELLAELLNGMAHTLNNRAATVRAVHQLLSADGAGPAHQLLEQEAGQLESMVTLLRLAGARPRPRPEPFVPGDVLRDAASLARQHDQLRDVPITLDPRAQSAAMADPAPLLHAVLVLLDCAGRHAAAHGGAVRLGAYDAEAAVELTVAVPSLRAENGTESSAIAAAGPLAAAAGARVQVRRTDHELQLVLTVPTLQAARSAEAAAASS